MNAAKNPLAILNPAATMRVVDLTISPGHNFFGHHGREADQHPTVRCDAVECVAGRGVRGDRFFDYKPDYAGQITFFAEEVWSDLCEELNVHDRATEVFRRNVISRGVDLNALIGREFTVQGVRFRGVCESKPCYWMNTAFGPGAEVALRGNGGLRAQILTDGILRRD